MVTDTAKAEVSDNTKLNLNDALVANAEIKSTVIQKQKILNYVTLRGAIDILPQDKLWVTTLIRSNKIYFVKHGDQVKERSSFGYLGRFSFYKSQQDYLSSVSALHYAQIEYDRQKSLNDNQATSQRHYCKTEEKYRQYQIEVASLEEKLKMISINPKHWQLLLSNLQSASHRPHQGQILSIPTHRRLYWNRYNLCRNSFLPIQRAVLKVFESCLS